MIETINKPPIFTTTVPLVLGSGSPRRKEMLARLGLEFETDPSKAEEPPPRPGQTPEDYAREMARQKCLEILPRHEGKVVLTADTIVAADDRILGKPSDEAHARDMLSFLSGRSHEVLTGCALMGPKDKVNLFTARTEVDFIDLTPEMISAYIATGEPMDKAGSYGIQGVGSFMVREVRGSYTNVVGLPLARLLELLLKWGVVIPEGKWCAFV